MHLRAGYSQTNLSSHCDGPISVMALDIAGSQITSISAIVNPDKLAHLGPVADFRSLLRSAQSRG
jgi:RNA polymerase sigma-70 factor (ECF subfamily)